MKTVDNNRVLADIRSVVRKRELFDTLRESTILITGATGLIGSMLVKTLCYANEQHGLNLRVIGQVRSFTKVETVFGAGFNAAEFIIKPNVECNYIVHTVSPTTSKYFIEHPVETIESSVGSTIEILKVAKDNNAPMVYLSSMEQYGIPFYDGQIMTEEELGVIDHLSIRSSYSESKRLCECLCASYASEYGVRAVIARLAQTFGAGVSLSDHRMPMQFARAAVRGEDIVLHTEGKSISNFVYLTDALSAILIILKYGQSGQAYNICNDEESRSVKEIADLVANEVSPYKISVSISVSNENKGYAPTSRMYMNSKKLRNMGWRPEVGMREAYLRLVDYLQEFEHDTETSLPCFQEA